MAEQDVPADDVIGLLKEIDPRKISRDRFVALLSAAQRGDGVDFGELDAHSFARLITRASGDQLTAVFGHPELRAIVLDEIFRRMGDHLRADRASHTKAVVHWRLTDGTGEGGYDRWETVIEYGTCVVNRMSTREPRATITLRPIDFVRLVTHNASGPVLFMTGKLKVNGDLGFVAGLTSLFDLPKAK